MTLRRALLAGAFTLAQIAQAFADPATVPMGAPVVVIPAIVAIASEPSPFGLGRTYYRVLNPGLVTDGTAWCARGTATPPGVNAAGSFPIAPLGNALGAPWKEEFNSTTGGYVPQGALVCVSDGGPGGSAAAKLTVETR